jgi:hypothetical protein
MQTTFKFVAMASFVIALFGCAGPVTQRVNIDPVARAREERTQQMVAIRSEFELARRMWTVGYGVLKGAASECGATVRPSLGMMLLTKQLLPQKVRDAAAEALGVDERVKVYGVYKGSAAELAGVKVGDILLNGRSVMSPPNESREAAAVRLVAGRPVPLQVQRGTQTLALSAVPDKVCDYPLRLANTPAINAFADGKSIHVTRGMMRFAGEDRELALVIGHELGHNTMGHISKKQGNAVVGAIFDALAASRGINTQSAFMKAGAGAYSQDFEAEADYVGLYYLARAGYDTEGAADFWRRMAAEQPASIKGSYSATHPATTERFLALEKESAEIRSKEASGAELVPNRAAK